MQFSPTVLHFNNVSSKQWFAISVPQVVPDISGANCQQKRLSWIDTLPHDTIRIWIQGFSRYIDL